jgi:hypothetical protein
MALITPARSAKHAVSRHTILEYTTHRLTRSAINFPANGVPLPPSTP